jgi:hypothetical protein
VTSFAVTLAPGARVCIAENAAAFAARYGAGGMLAGQFLGNLSDGGEILRMIDGARNIITIFDYKDIAPWPLPPDGDGPALVLKAPDLDPTIGSNWRASYSTGGKPGSIDILSVADWRARYFSAADLADPAKARSGAARPGRRQQNIP